MVYTLRFLPLKNAVCFIILMYLVPVLFTFYIQCDKIKKNHSGAKRLRDSFYFNCVCGFVIDAVVLFFRNDVTLGLWMLSFGSLLTFCDSTYWPLVIDVYTTCLQNTVLGS